MLDKRGKKKGQKKKKKKNFPQLFRERVRKGGSLAG